MDQQTPEDSQNNHGDSQKPSKKYGGRPAWQWVLIYLVVGAVIYFIVYALFFKSGSSGGIY